MNQAHKILADYIINYLKTSNKLDVLRNILSKGAILYRNEVYVLNLEEEIKDISESVESAVWYLKEFIEDFEEEIFNKIFIGRYDFDEDDKEEFEVFYIDGKYIKCICNYKKTELSLVEPKNVLYGKIDIDWFNQQMKPNFHSDVAEILQEIKNNIIPLEQKQEWIEIK